jgi:hypothetical protein
MQNIEPTPDEIAARMAVLRERAAAGPLSLEQAAKVLGIPAADLTAELVTHELATKPGTVAMIVGADGTTIIKPAGDNFSIMVPMALAKIFLAALMTDPAANVAICAPLPVGSPERH